MNRNCPKTYCETSTAESIDATKDLIAYIRSLSSDLVRPVLTPRFAISCTDDLLLALGQLAKEDPDLHIQTHISENSDEIEFTKSLFPACSSYTDVYLKHGLLTPRTILAHGVHLEDEELEVIESQGAGISHCPTSNFNLSSGMAKVGKMLDRGIKVNGLVSSPSPLLAHNYFAGWTRNRCLWRVLSLHAYCHTTCLYMFKDGRTEYTINREKGPEEQIQCQQIFYRNTPLPCNHGWCATVLFGGQDRVIRTGEEL